MTRAGLMVGLAALIGMSVPSRAAEEATARAGEVTIERGAVADAPEIGRLVEVDDVRLLGGGDVTGTLVNRAAHPVREIKLAIEYNWLWRNEMRPGIDDPGRADFNLIAEEIPPGGRVRFTYRPSQPLPRRDDGRFEPIVTVLSLVQIVPPRESATP